MNLFVTARWVLDELDARMTALFDDWTAGVNADMQRERDAASDRWVEADKALAVERTLRASVQAQIESHRTTIDFLTKEVNTLNLERAALLTRLTGIEMPTVEIIRSPDAGQKVAAVRVEDLVEKLPSFKEAQRERDEKSAIGDGEAENIEALFEDLPEDIAAKMGIGLSAVGEVEYRK